MLSMQKKTERSESNDEEKLNFWIEFNVMRSFQDNAKNSCIVKIS